MTFTSTAISRLPPRGCVDSAKPAKLFLNLKGNVSNFVNEERAFVRHLEYTLPVAYRAR